jgi:hypothetical protein
LTAEQSLSLHNLESQGKFQFWKSPRIGSGSDIMAAPEQIHELKSILKNLNIQFETMVEDVQS